MPDTDPGAVVESKAGREVRMYTGTMIEELIKAVERAEQHEQELTIREKLYYELDSTLLGVA